MSPVILEVEISPARESWGSIHDFLEDDIINHVSSSVEDDIHMIVSYIYEIKFREEI